MSRCLARVSSAHTVGRFRARSGRGRGTVRPAVRTPIAHCRPTGRLTGELEGSLEYARRFAGHSNRLAAEKPVEAHWLGLALVLRLPEPMLARTGEISRPQRRSDLNTPSLGQSGFK
jgi:hypothetical protein